ncbi:MAG: protoporphyrinogen oxidase [Candidatus Rokubacteria bacterium 13_2_20CM_2_64_8]|nr:MAG: protoporphyrinogen oxidase [Candidatus Rokubacteria bacterium 13_2_20CM_69_10]OLB43613.1 MAG: protoporphyrinogen oxidase [Candidatus Rokubacteria bacterium 13_2_20CM_2_64_8]
MRLVIVGGGIAGLTAAHRAVEISRERGTALELTVLEARDRLGGTIETEHAGGFLVETGPDSFLSEKPWGLALCRRIGLESRLVGTDDRFRRVFVWFGKRLHPVPDGFQLLAPTRLTPFVTSSLFSWPGKLRMALDVILPRGGGGDESLGAFVRRRLGREALERIAQPLVAGIYTADPDELSLLATMPRFVELERRERSLIVGLWKASRKAPAASTSGARWSLFVSLAGGMGELIAALASRLPSDAVRLKHRVGGIERRGAHWRVTTEEAGAIDADAVIVATETHAASRLLRYVDPPLATMLEMIPYASSATVSLGYRRADVPHPLDGFGFVVPRAEHRDLLACTFSSVKYPGRAPERHVLIRCFVGGALNAAALERSDDEIVERVRRELGEALGITAAPMLTRVARHPASMPQYAVGHLTTVETIERRLAAIPGLLLAGGGYRGVGIADCVRSGEAAADAAFARR